MSDGEHQNRMRCETLLPHARRVLRHASRLGPSIKDCVTLLHNVDFFRLRTGEVREGSGKVLKAYDLLHFAHSLLLHLRC